MNRRLGGLGAAAFALLLGGCGPLGGDAAELPFRDDFSGACEWAQASNAAATLGCANGGYRVLVKRTDRPIAAHHGIDSTSALRVGAHAELTAGPRELSGDEGAAYGVGCWTRIGGDGYVFLVNPAGFAVIGEMRREVGGFRPLAQTEAIFEGAADSLELRADCIAPAGEDAKLALAVNGRTVLAAEDPSPPRTFRDVGFYVATTSAGTEVRFDDLTADELAGAELEAALRQEEPTVELGEPATLLREDFSNAESGWPAGRAQAGSFGYAGGGYRVRLDRDGTIRRGVLFSAIAARGVEILAVAEEQPGRPAAYGIGCYANPEQGYVFLVESSGAWSIQEERPGARFVTLESGVGRAVERPAELAASCAGSREGRASLTFSVAGERVASFEDPDGLRSFRGVAVVARSGSDESEIRFDDVIVRRR